MAMNQRNFIDVVLPLAGGKVEAAPVDVKARRFWLEGQIANLENGKLRQNPLLSLERLIKG